MDFEESKTWGDFLFELSSDVASLSFFSTPFLSLLFLEEVRQRHPVILYVA